MEVPKPGSLDYSNQNNFGLHDKVFDHSIVNSIIMFFVAIAAVALAGTATASAELSPTPWLMPRNGTYDPTTNTSGILPVSTLKKMAYIYETMAYSL